MAGLEDLDVDMSGFNWGENDGLGDNDIIMRECNALAVTAMGGFSWGEIDGSGDFDTIMGECNTLAVTAMDLVTHAGDILSASIRGSIVGGNSSILSINPVAPDRVQSASNIVLQTGCGVVPLASGANTGTSDVTHTHARNTDIPNADTNTGSVVHASGTNTETSTVTHTHARNTDIPIADTNTGSVPDTEVNVQNIPKFNAKVQRSRIDFRDIPAEDLGAVSGLIKDRISAPINKAIEVSTPGSVLNVTLDGPSLSSSVHTTVYADNPDIADNFLDELVNVVQSNDSVMADDDLYMTINIALGSSGGSRVPLSRIPYDQIINRRAASGGLYSPFNEDNLCFSMCIAKYMNPGKSMAEISRIAKDIHTCTGFDLTHRVRLQDISAFEVILEKKIIVFHHTQESKQLLLFQTSDGPHDDHPTVQLYLHDEHYCLILKPNVFHGNGYACELCFKGYNDRTMHSCEYQCGVCFTDCTPRNKREADKKRRIKKCYDCNQICKSDFCYRQHGRCSPKTGYVPCNKLIRCTLCGVVYPRVGRRKRNRDGTLGEPGHECPERKCRHCDHPLYGKEKHTCFIQPTEKKDISSDYIVYDFETQVVNGVHVANYVAAMSLDKEHAFEKYGDDCVKLFIDRFRKPKYKGFTFIAHNAAGFDNHIVLRDMVNRGITPSTIMRGSRIVCMTDKHYKQRWLDSYSFLPMRLANTPAAMGFADMCKGHFPHKFNTPSNQDYVGDYPPPEFYGYEQMRDADKAAFMNWHNSVNGKTFDFRKELALYCRNDVEVLREAVVRYRKAFIESTNVDPLSHATLAGACMGVYKTNFLTKDTIALTYEGAYLNQNKTYSSVSIQWLEYLMYSEKTDIRHALNHGEEKIGRYHADGYIAETDTALDFLGCWYHGCTRCHRPGDFNTATNTTYGALYRQYEARQNYLIHDQKKSVRIIWECDWNRMKATDPDVQSFMKNVYKHPERLNPRDALYGGRTSAMKLFHEIIGKIVGQKLKYVDYTSLYPYVQSCKPYPTGHPEIHFKDFKPMSEYFGFVKCTILPPRGLYHPVLPVRCHGKLMFPLCNRCAIDLNQETLCTHGPDERMLSGTWVTFEVEKAIEKGYILKDIDEVWHFPERSETLFSGYVKSFMKTKQESSGYPPNVTSDEEKEKYIADYYAKEGIALDPAKICVNKAMRGCSKLLLNSLWGRFCLRSNLGQTEFVSDPSRFSQLIFSDDFKVSQFHFISESVAMVQWSHRIPQASKSKDVNVFIGAMTTAHARLTLYTLLDKLQQRVVYCDTDSAIFISNPGDWEPPLGPYLGDLTNELDEGTYITRYVSGGPKSYAYTTNDGKSIVKWKGITLNSKNAAIVTPEALIGLVKSFVANQKAPDCLYVTTDTIKRNKKRLELMNATVTKRVQTVYNKRVVADDFTTLPYGY